MNAKGQTFTLEGVASALILLLALYTLYQSSLVISPMWSEAVNVQTKIKAQDTLKILDTYEKVDGNFYNDSLQGMIVNLRNCSLGVNCTPNEDFNYSLGVVLGDYDYRLELYWVESGTVKSAVLVDRTPSPNAVAASRYILLNNSELRDSVFYRSGVEDWRPMIFEVRLIVWRP
jgi:hypothetical protein